MGGKSTFRERLPVDARYFARGGVGDAELDAMKELELEVGG